MNHAARIPATIVLLLIPFAAGCCCGPAATTASTPGTPTTTVVVSQVERDAERLALLYQRAKSGKATAAEGIGLLKELHLGKRLKPALTRLLRDFAGSSEAVQGLLKQREYFGELIQAELCIRGVVPACSKITYEPWSQIGARHDALMANVKPGALTADPTLAEIARLGGSSWTGGNAVETLIDGSASWAKRREMLAGAKRSIDVLTWAFYDDHTGWTAARALAQKAKEGVHVRVMLDRRVATHAPYQAVADWLRKQAFAPTSDGSGKGSLQLIGWQDPERPFDGQHRKIFIVDGRHLVAGGMNYGDWYSHQNPKEANRWRDTDVYVRGYAAMDASRLFHSLWNEQIRKRGLKVQASPFVARQPLPTTQGGEAVAVVSHQAGRDEHILLSLLRAIEATTTSIDIEMAYFIRIPSMASALRRAIARGVRVRLLTNSAESVDETLISSAILTTAKELSDAGAEVYLRRGSTLHSKFMILDRTFTSIGSYNLHPRSYRMEGEVMFHIVGTTTAASLTAAFEKDIQAADRIDPTKPLAIPTNPLTVLALRFFPDQL